MFLPALLLLHGCSKQNSSDTNNSIDTTYSQSRETHLELKDDIPYPKVEIDDTEVRTLKSEYVDQTYEIDIFFPKGYEADTTRYPVVYILDADYNFGCVSYIARRLIKNGDIPKVLLVGIAYNSTEEEYYQKRNRDCTPPSEIHGYHTGSVEDFVLFLKKELFPFINENYRTIPEDRTIVGHSIGGFFCCYSLFKHPVLFNSYIIVSPSLWFSNQVIFQYEEEFAKLHKELKASIYFATGLDESDRMVNTSQRFIKILTERGYQNMRFESMMAEDENHRSLFLNAFSKGIRFVFLNDKKK